MSHVQQSHKPITMVLLGTNSSNKCLIGNAILQNKCFMVGPAMIDAVSNSLVNILNPKDNLSEQDKTGKEELKPSYQDPRLFLLVLQNNTISQDEMKMFDCLKERFGEKMVENTIVVMVSEEERSGEPYERADDKLKKVLDECGKRVCVCKKNQDVNESELRKELMEKWDQMQKHLHEPINTATEEPLYVDLDDLKEPTNKGENTQPSADNYITVVLVGKNNADKCLIGNTILEEETFKLEDCETGQGKVEDQSILILKTPDSLKPEADSIDEMKPSYTGPRIFLFILHGKEVSPDEEKMFTQLKMTFREDIGENTILLVHSEDELNKSKSILTKKLLSECENKVCQYNKDIKKSELVKELMKYTDEILQKNQAFKSERERSDSNSCKVPPDNFCGTDDNHLPYKIDEEPTPNIPGEKQAAVPDHLEHPTSVHPEFPTSLHQYPQIHSTPMPPSILTLVLLGQTGSGKSASGNTILGHQCFESYASSVPVTQKCQEKEGTVSGIKIRVIDTPDFFNEDLKNQEEELRRCKDLIQHGSVVYLLVMELGRFTDGEREVLPRLKKEFGENMTAKTVILFTNQEKLKNKSLKDYINETNEELQQMIQTCDSRCWAFNNNNKSGQQVKELMDIVSKTGGNMPMMTSNRPSVKKSGQETKQKNKRCTIM